MQVAFADGFFDSLKRCFRPWWHWKELYYQVKCWAWQRYTTVKPRFLGHTWCDRSRLLPHMMFEILCQFVEDECSPGIVEWYGENGHKLEVNGKEKYVMDEMKDLRDWWLNQYHKRYPAMEERIWQELREIDKHKLSDFREEDDVCYWDPQYETTEHAEQADLLLKRLNLIEYAVENALDRRLERLLRVRRWMWT